MHALARSTHPAPATLSAPRRPHLRAVPSPARRRAPRAAAVGLYAMGLCAGFLLAALASAPGGAWVVTFQLQFALVAGTVCALALVRARAVARRESSRATRRTPL